MSNFSEAMRVNLAFVTELSSSLPLFAISGAGYTVGYVSKCLDSQYGTCVIKNIISRNAGSTFKFKQTGESGSPVQTFDFSNGGQQWPESDRLTFILSCKDFYGNR